MSAQTIDTLARTLAWLTIAEFVLIPTMIASFFISTKRLGCLVWLLRLVVMGLTVVIGLTLLLFIVGPL